MTLPYQNATSGEKALAGVREASAACEVGMQRSLVQATGKPALVDLGNLQAGARSQWDSERSLPRRGETGAGLDRSQGSKT